MKNLNNKFSINFLKSCKDSIKNDGLRGLIKKEGWSIVAFFFLFYLIRDSIIYILIPYIGISGLSSCF